MRRLLVFLLAANLLTFGWLQGWLDWLVAGEVPAQFHPERLRVVPLDRLGDPPSLSVVPED
jgi:hypothetical protein